MDREEIRRRLFQIVSEQGEIPLEKLQGTESLHRYGIDSLAGVNIAYEIGLLLGRDVPDSLIVEHDTLEKLVEYALT